MQIYETVFTVFKPLVNPCSCHKRTFSGHPLQAKNSFNDLHTPYFLSQTSIGNATSGTGGSWGHWNTLTVPTNL